MSKFDKSKVYTMQYVAKIKESENLSFWTKLRYFIVEDNAWPHKTSSTRFAGAD